MTPEHAQQTLDEIESWLAQGDLPSDVEAHGFLENLAVDALLDLAGKPGQALLRGMTLFDLPVPEGVAAKLEMVLGGSLRHLRDLGLLDVFTDLVDLRQAALASNALVAGRLAPLGEDERKRLAREVAATLFDAWGGVEGESKRPAVCNWQITRLALPAQDGAIVAACARDAVQRVLQQGPAATAAELGRAAIDLLDAQEPCHPQVAVKYLQIMKSCIGDWYGNSRARSPPRRVSAALAVGRTNARLL